MSEPDAVNLQFTKEETGIARRVLDIYDEHQSRLLQGPDYLNFTPTDIQVLKGDIATQTGNGLSLSPENARKLWDVLFEAYNKRQSDNYADLFSDVDEQTLTVAIFKIADVHLDRKTFYPPKQGGAEPQ